MLFAPSMLRSHRIHWFFVTSVMNVLFRFVVSGSNLRLLPNLRSELPWLISHVETSTTYCMWKKHRHRNSGRRNLQEVLGILVDKAIKHDKSIIYLFEYLNVDHECVSFLFVFQATDSRFYFLYRWASFRWLRFLLDESMAQDLQLTFGACGIQGVKHFAKDLPILGDWRILYSLNQASQ